MRLTVYYTARPEPFDSPLILSLSTDERLAQDRPFDSPLILSLSKDERLAQDRPVEGRALCSWFDKLTTGAYVPIVRTHRISAHSASPD